MNYVDQQTLKPDDDYVLPHQRLWTLDVLVCPLSATERFLLQPLVCGTVFHRTFPPLSLSMFCCRLKSLLFSLSYPVLIILWWFWYQSKAHMRLPISPSLWLWSCLAPFLRYGDLLAKIAHFLPLSHSAPSLPMSFLEFGGEVSPQETRVIMLNYSKDPVIVAWVVLTWYQTVTDGHRDRQTDEQANLIYHS